MPALDQPLNETELDELDELLLTFGERLEEQLGEEIDSVICVTELDGFFTALISGPVMVPPSEWYPALWAGHPPLLEDQAQVQHVFELLIRHMNGIAAHLQGAPSEFEPMFGERTVEGKHYTIVDEWCHGYLRGVGLRAEQWQPLLDDLPEILDVMELFVSPEGWQELDKLEDEQIAEMQATIPCVVRDIHAYWLRRRIAPATMVRSGPKAGRNDPCPCGSGRKYKQCCLH